MNEQELLGEEPETRDEMVVTKEDFHIQQRVYDMILYAYPALEQFPKSQKFSLAQDIKLCMDKVLRLVIAANKKYTKRTTLRDLDVEVAALKVYIRVAADLKYLPLKKYEVWSGMVVEIGKMVGGWIKSQNEAAEPAKEPTEAFFCSECGEAIPAKAEKYSRQFFGRPLCYKCQKRHRK